MKRRRSDNVLTFIALLAFTLFARESAWGQSKVDGSALQAELEEMQPRCFEAKIAEHNTYALIELPPSITKRDIARYAVILKLSEAQRQNLNRLFEDYSESITAIMTQSQPALDEAANAMGKASEKPADMIRAYEDLQSAIEPVAKQMRSAEDPLCRELAATLAPEQLQAMPRVRLHRARQNWFIYASWLNANQIDLSELVDIACPDAFAVEPLEALRWEYEQARTAAIDRLVRHWTEHQMANLVAMANLNAVEAADGAPPDQAAKDAAAAATQSRKEFAREAFAAEQQIMEVNRRYLPKFVAGMPADSRDAFRMRYLLRAYPAEILNDPTDPQSLVTLVLARQNLPEEVRAAIDALWTTHHQRQEQLLNQLCAEHDRWIDRFVVFNGTKEANRFAHDQQQFKLFRQRLDSNEEFVRAFVSLLPADAAEELNPPVESLQAKSKQQREYLAVREERARQMVETLNEIGD